MRYVIFGAGAIGGVVGARLHQSGHDVVLIARGAHYEKLASDGLTLATPSERVTLQLPVAPTAAAAGLRDGDVVLLCTKSQHTWEALTALREAAPVGGLPVVCLQNGVENERLALRLFPETYGAVLLLPAEHLEPGYIIGYAAKLSGRIDLGRYPSGVDAGVAEISAALVASRFESEPRDDIMRHKHAKLIDNLANGVQAICGFDDPEGNLELVERVRREGREILDAAGIQYRVQEVGDMHERLEHMGMGEVDGHPHQGGSTWQSVTRGTGNVETDYLNGEIVLIGRQLRIPTPFNETIQTLARTSANQSLRPGWRKPRELIAEAEGRLSTALG
jgi:2-dehydropantoate 2-reductase